MDTVLGGKKIAVDKHKFETKTAILLRRKKKEPGMNKCSYIVLLGDY